MALSMRQSCPLFDVTRAFISDCVTSLASASHQESIIYSQMLASLVKTSPKTVHSIIIFNYHVAQWFDDTTHSPSPCRFFGFAHYSSRRFRPPFTILGYLSNTTLGISYTPPQPKKKKTTTTSTIFSNASMLPIGHRGMNL